MSRSLRRGTLAATALAFSIVTLAACGAGNDAQTLQVKPDNAAISVDNGKIKIQNAIVITQPREEAKGHAVGEGPAVVAATVFNNGDKPQTLDSVKLGDSSATVKLTPAKDDKGGKGTITVPAGGSVIIGGKGNASAVVENGREAAKNGNAQPVTFSFSETGDVTLRAFVVPAVGHFEGFGPDKVPATPAATTSPTGSPTGSATGTPATGTPATGASGTPAKKDGDKADKNDAAKNDGAKNSPTGSATTGAGR
ncbi:copper chaperone PCu(A)C [Streptomyces sp. NBC_00237]|uniref:DUF461 domain-containing protein n=1 Tax=Streptomyces sp. NBC_00237 TaxID=2975687 RepID=UPI00225A5555|nr:DUF461 domain-containing protein [Streptomyces sp. NBC_00237]MCX5200383.1 copper chaperone PCu(A)C [Streptomyces sp. NBC_00237]